MQRLNLNILSCLIFLVGSACSSAQNPETKRTNPRNEVFIPDTAAERLAVKMDSIYFPVFLKTLEHMRNEDYGFLDQYYAETTLNPPGNLKQIISIDSYQPDISIYFSSQGKTINKIMADTGKYKIDFPVDWKANPKQDRTWQLYFSYLDWVRCYLQSDDIDTALTGLKVVWDFLSNNLDYPPKNGEFIFDDMAVGFRLELLVYALEKYQSMDISDERFYHRLLSGILSHIAFMSSLKEYICYHNHGIFIDQSLMYSSDKIDGLLIKDEITDLAFRRCTEQFLFCFTEDGVHKEHTPSYHILMTSKLEKLISFAVEKHMELPGKLQNIFIEANDFSRYLFRPNGLLPPIGDCNIKKMDADLKKIDSGHPVNLDPIKVYPHADWAFFNSGADCAINVIIQADFFSFSHYHEDETSFIITAGYHELIIDPGIYSYNHSSPYDLYMRQARAHNVLLVDNQGFNPKLSNAGLSGITRYVINDNAKNNWKGIIEMTHPHYLIDPGVEVYRQFGQINDSCFVIKDITRADTLHLYSQVFHFAPGATIKRTDSNNFIVSWPDHGLKIYLAGNSESYDLIKGSMDPVQGWYFPERLEVLPQPVLVLYKTGSSGEFITFLSISRGNEIPGINYLQNNAMAMFDSLNAIPRENLEKQHYPERWKSKY
jgi:hypothetical protein